jgi:methionyl-tRNA formyltransferase
MKFGLFIVGEKGRYILENLLNENLIPSFVVSYKDKNVIDDAFNRIFNLCIEKHITFLLKKDIKPLKLLEIVDKVFVIGWQFLLKENLEKFIILHDSKLPEYKGWSPTVNYLIDGKDYLAVTAFEPTIKLDTGNIYTQEIVKIKYPMKIEKALEIVGNLCVIAIKKIIRENPTPYLMEGKESFCIWRDYNDYFINWHLPSHVNKRFVDAVGYPFAGAKIKYLNTILTVLECELVEEINIIGRSTHIGKIWSLLDDQPTVICGTGLLKLTKVVNDENIEYKFKKLKERL